MAQACRNLFLQPFQQILELYSTASAAAEYDFDSLYIPFRCTASDIDSSKSVVLYKGQLGHAIRVSVTYPFYFKPVELDGKLLFDGGMYNNVPVDVAVAEFHPDFIIGSKTTRNAPGPAEDDIVSQFKNMITRETSFELPEDRGVMIEPLVPQVNVIDFSRNKEMIDSGYAAALRMMPEIKAKVITWSVSGGGTVSAAGVFTAGAAAGGPFTVTATSGLTEEELRRILDERMDEVLEMKQSGEMERRRDKAQGIIREIEALVPAVQAALKKSRFGKDAVQKPEGVMARARAAIDAGDLHQLSAIEEQLDRTLQLFKGLAGGASPPPGET